LRTTFRFEVGRDRNNHVGFGLGAHFCLGANLARLEIRVMFEELLNRFDHFELEGPLAWMNNNRLVGLTELPVKAFPPSESPYEGDPGPVPRGRPMVFSARGRTASHFDSRRRRLHRRRVPQAAGFFGFPYY
jgi:hypothetical protein